MRVQLLNSFLFLDGYMQRWEGTPFHKGVFRFEESVLLSSSFPSFPDPVRSQGNAFLDLKGEAEISMRWQGESDDWIKALKEGQMKLQGVSFSHRKVPLPLSQIEGSIFALSRTISISDA